MGYDDGQCTDKYKWAGLMGWHIDRPEILLVSNQPKDKLWEAYGEREGGSGRERLAVVIAISGCLPE